MALQYRTLAKAADRKRFVTEAAAFPFLRNRERQNARRGYRETLHALDEVLRGSTYGTGNAQAVALEIALLAGCLERYAAQLKNLPTIVEMKAAAARRERLSQWRPARTSKIATTETDTRLAAD
jgi:hypothetical protein